MQKGSEHAAHTRCITTDPVLTSHDHSLPVQLHFAGATLSFHHHLMVNISQSDKHTSSQQTAHGSHCSNLSCSHHTGCTEEGRVMDKHTLKQTHPFLPGRDSSALCYHTMTGRKDLVSLKKKTYMDSSQRCVVQLRVFRLWHGTVGEQHPLQVQIRTCASGASRMYELDFLLKQSVF